MLSEARKGSNHILEIGAARFVGDMWWSWFYCKPKSVVEAIDHGFGGIKPGTFGFRFV